MLRFRCFPSAPVTFCYLLLGVLLGTGLEASGAEKNLETLRFEGRQITVKRDPLTRLPLTMRAAGVPLLEIKGIAKLTRDQITLAGPLLAKKYKKFLQIEPDELRLKAAERVGGTWYVSYWQTVKGWIIYESSLGFSIDPQGKILSLGALLYPQVALPEGIKINRESGPKNRGRPGSGLQETGLYPAGGEHPGLSRQNPPSHPLFQGLCL